MVTVDDAVWARVVLAAKERNIDPGAWVEHWLVQGLKAHGKAMEDVEFEAVCRRATQRNEPTPMRHEFDRSRKPRITDPG